MGWLILASFTRPIAGALVATGLISGILRLARARAERVEHMPVTGTDQYSNGVPMDEAQFRTAYAAMQAELDQLPPLTERKRMADAASVRRREQAFDARRDVSAGVPMLGDADRAWAMYQANSRYATRRLGCRHEFPVARRTRHNQ